MSNQDSRRFIFFLPNLFTALNIGCGFVAIIFAINNKYYEACMLLLLGALFDSVDGRVARLTGTQSVFGEQFDSLSDAISFGMAPALIFYNRFLATSGRIGIIISFLFVLCGTLRLARFNANTSKMKSDFFQGMPIPGAALGIIGFVLLSTEYPNLERIRFLPELYILLYSIMMITNIPFQSFKNSLWIKTHRVRVLMFICMIIATVFIKEQLMIFFWISVYVLLSIGYYLLNRSKLKEIFSKKTIDDTLEENI